ncbi:MAG TPA: hypothetical protein VL490_08720 [Mucilaginibacter sp.]|nr:hypothetical protein [Mucilaginibacter sp.]
MDKKINLYGINNQSPLLYIHFDKTIYTTNENVWFTGYLLNCINYNYYKTLSVSLVKDEDHKVVKTDKFVIKNGLAFGNTIIPDTAVAGNYTFIAITNRLLNGKPEVVFSQPVTIKADVQQDYTASLNPLDTGAAAIQQKVMLNINFDGEKVQPVSVPVSYYVGNSLHPVLAGIVKTTAGQYVFTIPSKLLSPANNHLHVLLTYKGENRDIELALPVMPQPAIVRFFPEGGNLVNNLNSTIGWEVKTAAGTPAGVTAFLYKDKQLIDTLYTNSYGMGKFTLKPKTGSNYYVKLYNLNHKDTSYLLPRILEQGACISLAKALVNDTLTVELKDEKKEKLFLTGHNYRQLFFTVPVTMTGIGKKVKLIIKNVPRGLMQLTLTDSLGRPLSERIFFAHFDQRTLLEVSTEKKEYKPRQKVNVNIKLNSTLPDSGYISIACVQANRIQINEKNDIESFFYLKNALGILPARESYLANNEADRQFLENVLLIKGWRRYTWTDILNTKPTDTLKYYQDLAFKGNVTRFSSALKKSVDLVGTDRSILPITTKPNGEFILKDDDLAMEFGQKITLVVKGANAPDYRIMLNDPYIKASESVIAQLIPENYAVQAQRTTSYINLAANDHAINLKGVQIRANKDNSFYAAGGGPNACGDFVCVNNILNCRNHIDDPRNRPAIKGQVYYINGTTQTTYYTKCAAPDEYKLILNGIYTQQEFYPIDYSKESPSQPEYQSTIFWKHFVKVFSLKDTNVSFYTGDITREFKIIIQGITSNDVTTGETTFKVTD